MEWGQVITIIFGISSFMAIFMRRFDSIEKRINKLEEDIREIGQLLYRALGEPTKPEG